jgi:hypothetical protein
MRGSVVRALIVCAFLAFTGESTSMFVHARGLSYFDEVLIENVITGVLGGALILLYLEERRRRTTSRMEEIAFLNHHIRNALTAITLSGYAGDDTLRLEIVSDASRRIEMALKRMSEQEHVALEPLKD